jgi:hypothetical protein
VPEGCAGRFFREDALELITELARQTPVMRLVLLRRGMLP